MTDPGPLSNVRDDAWRRLANEKAKGAEHDSSERRSFSGCLPGTRIDLLNMLEKELTQDNPRFIWLFGGSGSGKSSVAHSIAERLSGRNQLAATFFFSRKHLSRSSIDLTFLTIAYQIGLLHPRAKDVITKAIRDDPALLSSEKSRRSQFEALVMAPLRELQFVWETKRAMIFDAADEASAGYGEQIHELAQMLAELLRHPAVPISAVLVTSRPLSLLESIPMQAGISNFTRTLRIESFDASHDVELFLRRSFKKIHAKHQLEAVHPHPWPSEPILQVLFSQTGGQFIVAATILRVIRDAPNPIERLEVVVNMYRAKASSVNLSLGDINSVYHYILSDCEPSNRRPTVECLADIIALAEPLSLSNICKLFARDVQKHTTRFSAIMHVPPMESSASVQIYHSSLRDFLSDRSRSRDFHVNPVESHRRLACLCLKTMQRELKKDICGLGEPTKFHTEIEDFDDRRNASISYALRYACLYWSYHLERTSQDLEIESLVVHFLRKQLLFFLEASSVLGCLHLAVASLTDARDVISGWESFNDQEDAVQLLYDAWRLISLFFDPVRDSALQLYESALPLCPLDTHLRRVYQGTSCAESAVFIEDGLDSQWDHVIRTFNDNSASITMSPDGLRMAMLCDDGLRLTDTVTGVLIASTGPGLAPDRVAFSHSGPVIACQHRTGRAYLWHPQLGVIDELVDAEYDAAREHGLHGTCAFAQDDMLFASGASPSNAPDFVVHLFERTARGGSWAPRSPLRLPIAGGLQDIGFSHVGKLMVVTGRGAYIIDPEGNTLHEHLHGSFNSFFHWHTFSHEGNVTLHVNSFRLGGNNVDIARLNDIPGSSSASRADEAKTIRDPTGRKVVAVLLGDYMYTQDRQMSLLSLSKHGQALSVVKYAVGKAAVIDLNLLRSLSNHWLLHWGQTSMFRSFGLLRCRPDTKEAVLIKFEDEQAPMRHITSIVSGWKMTLVTLTNPDPGFKLSSPNQMTASYNLDMISFLDMPGQVIRLRSLKNSQAWDVTPNVRWDNSDMSEMRLANKVKQEFSPKSTYFSFAAYERLWVWFANDGRLVGVIYGLFSTYLYAFTFSHAETRLAALEQSGAIGIYSIGTSIAAINRVLLPTIPRSLSSLCLAFNGSEHGVDLLMVNEGKPDNVTFWRHKTNTGNIVQLGSQRISGPLFHLIISPNLQRYHCNVSNMFLETRDSPLMYTVNIKTPPLDGHQNQCVSRELFLVDPIPQNAVIDICTWSNVTIADGWLHVGSRRVCWLPERYRPVGMDLSVFADRVVYKIGENYRSTLEKKSMVLGLRGIYIHYYDW